MRAGAVIVAALSWLGAGAALAQDAVLPDASMGTQVDFLSSEYTISGGRYGQGDVNLFHSFSRFDVPFGNAAVFTADRMPQRVLARVTGGDTSDIAGEIRSEIPGADLFLINPWGIEFERGASIDVQGSFFASSADVLRFAGADFPARSAEPPSAALLQVANPLAFGFLTEPPDGLVGPAPVDLSFVEDLRVPAGETLGLVGGRIQSLSRNEGVIRSPGSVVALVAAGPGVDVPLPLTEFDVSALPDGTQLGDVNLFGGTRIFANSPDSSSTPGSIWIRGGRFVMEATSILSTANLSDQDASAPAIDAQAREEIAVRGGSDLETGSVGSGWSGDIVLEAPSVVASGEGTEIRSVSVGATPATGCFAPASCSALRIDAGTLRVEDEAELLSRSLGGAGGLVSVEAAELTLARGGGILSEATSSGPGGAIRVVADSLSISDAGFSPDGTVIASAASAAGDGGAIDIETGTLSLRDGGQILTRTEGAGGAGALRVTAERVEALGRSAPEPAPLALAADAGSRPSGIRTQTEGAGDAGAMSIQAAFVEVGNGAGFASTSFGPGNAGSLTIGSPAERAQQVLVQGGLLGASSIATDTVVSAASPDVGAGGQLTIYSGRFELLDGGQVTASTSGTQPAGNVVIHADAALIRGVDPLTGQNESGVFAQSNAANNAAGGDGGQLAMFVDGDLVIADQGRISVETSGGGDAGVITLELGGALRMESDAAISALSTGDGSSGSVIVSRANGVSIEGSAITARALGSSDAGLVRIEAGPFLAMRDSVITTDSAEGSGGVVEINAGQRVDLVDSEISTSVRVASFQPTPGDPQRSGGNIDIDAGRVLDMRRSFIRTNSELGSGGRVGIQASEWIDLVDSGIETNVPETVRIPGGSEELPAGGDIAIDPQLVTLNLSAVQANSAEGPGGRIEIVAGALLLSSGSVVEARSGVDLPGEVIIQAPTPELAGQLAQLPVSFADASRLMKAACGTRGREVGSFVVADYEGIPASPEGPLPAPVAWPEAGAVGTPSAGGRAGAVAAPVQLVAWSCPHEGGEMR